MLPAGEASTAAKLTARDYNAFKLTNPTNATNQKVLGTVLGQQLGLDANTMMTPSALAAVGKQLRSFLDTVRDPLRQLITDPSETIGKIAALNNKYTLRSGALLDHPDVKDLIDAVSSGTVSGADLGEISSNLSSAASKAPYQLGRGLRDLQQHVEGIVKEGMTPQVQQSYEDALSRYGLFKELHDNVLNAATGEIDTGKLVRYFKQVDPQGYSEGAKNTPLYSVLRQSEGMGSNPMDATTAFHTKLAVVARAAAKTVPGGAQNVLQFGIKPTLRALMNKPGFVAALGGELNSSGLQQQLGSSP
jgi:hypothetical protein